MEHIEVIEYADCYKDYFKTLNYEWIEKFFEIEEKDKYVLANPEEAILNKGGFVYFAKLDNEIVGTVSLIRVEDTEYEISKMAVTEKHQNRGIGKQLIDFAIQKGKEIGVKKLVLYSNTNLATAINMYIKFGFRVIPKTDIHNRRSNIKMALILD